SNRARYSPDSMKAFTKFQLFQEHGGCLWKIRQTGQPTGVMLQIGTRNTQNFRLLKSVRRQREFPALLDGVIGLLCLGSARCRISSRAQYSITGWPLTLRSLSNTNPVWVVVWLGFFILIDVWF